VTRAHSPVVVVASLLAWLVAAPLAWPTTTALHHDGKIAYSAGSTIGLITPSGAPAGTVPHCSACNEAGELQWSPGGRKLAFIRGVVHGGVPDPWKFGLFVSSANGTHLRRVLRCDDCGPAQGSSIFWSPGGSRIVVPHDRRLALVNVKTGSHRLVASCAAGSGNVPWSPAWSPDGSEIAYACGPSLHLISRTGRHAHMLVSVPGTDQLDHLAWSPAGNVLAFDGTDSMYAVSADGSHLRTLVSGQAGSGPGFPSWSPDGARILYAYTPGTPSQFFFEVWVMNADGGQKQRLYRSSQRLNNYAPPIWSPSGKQIAFSIFTDAESGLMIMNADGSALHRIAPEVETLAWQPRTVKSTSP
jgi:dipeptidyl aminopeptidase/acylaminoacyl peptidase